MHDMMCTQLTTALTRAKMMPMKAETKNMRRKSSRETRRTIPGLAVLVACFRMVRGRGDRNLKFFILIKLHSQ